MGENDRENIVEIVSNSRRESPQAVHLLSLKQLLLHHPLAGCIAENEPEGCGCTVRVTDQVRRSVDEQSRPIGTFQFKIGTFKVSLPDQSFQEFALNFFTADPVKKVQLQKKFMICDTKELQRRRIAIGE